MEAFLTRTRGTLTAAGVDYHLALTDQPLEQTLLQLLVAARGSALDAEPGDLASLVSGADRTYRHFDTYLVLV